MEEGICKKQPVEYVKRSRFDLYPVWVQIKQNISLQIQCFEGILKIRRNQVIENLNTTMFNPSCNWQLRICSLTTLSLCSHTKT
jgi:hypothetical protein